MADNSVEPKLVEGATLADIENYLASTGFKSARRQTSQGHHFLGVEAPGYTFNMILYGNSALTDENAIGDVVQLNARFRIPSYPANERMETINRWNSSRIFGRAHLDENGDFVIEWAFIYKACRRDLLGTQLVMWMDVLARFKGFLQDGGRP